MDAEQHTRRVRGFSKETVYMVAESQLETKRNSARAAADAARQIDKQRMIGIDHASLAGKLRFQALACDGIAEEQRARVLIIDKEAVGVPFGGFTPLLDRDAVILFVFNHRYAVAAQLRFFPCPGIGRHMHGDVKTDTCAHDANRHPQVAGGADGDAVLAKELLKFRGQQLAIVIFGSQ